MAAGLVEGVDGRVGGMTKSEECRRLVEFVCALAREDAVGALYPRWWLGPATFWLTACVATELVSSRDDRDAFRLSRRVVLGGDGDLRTECDF